MNEPDGPADVRMMAIVHRALRRDLARARAVLVADPPPAGEQRRALGEHLLWMMEFLHAHHTSEDEGLWPLLRQRNPGAGELIDSLERDHERIAVAMDAVTSAATQYGGTTDDARRVALGAALEQLEEVLVPHLDREVADAMPVVARSITRREWEEIDRRFNLAPKSMRQLALEGHWLLDELDPEGRDVVVHLVPPVQRFVLVHGFARMYRRQAARCWSPVVPAPRSLVR